MKIEDHLTKAERLSKTRNKITSEEDWETFIENAYNTGIQLIAVICEKRFGEHLDTHKGIPRFLEKHGMEKLANKFRELDELRQGRWYGKQENGETMTRVKEIIKQIEDELKGVGVEEE